MAEIPTLYAQRPIVLRHHKAAMSVGLRSYCDSIGVEYTSMYSAFFPNETMQEFTDIINYSSDL
jgi:hypothetical protein